MERIRRARLELPLQVPQPGCFILGVDQNGSDDSDIHSLCHSLQSILEQSTAKPDTLVPNIDSQPCEDHRLQAQPDWEQRICDLFTGWQRGDDTLMNAALFLEMSPEATRDPQIAEAIAAADQDARQRFLDWFAQHGRAQGATPEHADLHARALALQGFIEA